MGDTVKEKEAKIILNYRDAAVKITEKKEKQAYEAVDKDLRTFLSRIILLLPRLIKRVDRKEEATAPAELYSQTQPENSHIWLL